MNVEILPDAEALARRAADLFAAAAQEAAAARGRFAVALSGGETPRGLYRLLARRQFSQKIPWRRVRLYWSDERCVPPSDDASNYGMARDAFLAHVPIPEAGVHRVRGELAPKSAALAYEKELGALAALERPPQRVPVFDLVSLGVGPDGHTASLFPHCAALADESRLVMVTEAPDGLQRVTVTLQVINAARHVWFLVSGDEKIDIVAEVLGGALTPDACPAQCVAPQHGTLTWLLDEAAAAGLSRELRERYRAG
jgi:6-phosphogluconolactonase